MHACEPSASLNDSELDHGGIKGWRHNTLSFARDKKRVTDTARPRTSWSGGIASGTEKEKGHQVHEMVFSSAVEVMFKETAMFTSRLAKVMASKVNRASHGPRVLAKERTRKVRQTEHPKDKCKFPRVPKFRIM